MILRYYLINFFNLHAARKILWHDEVPKLAILMSFVVAAILVLNYALSRPLRLIDMTQPSKNIEGHRGTVCALMCLKNLECPSCM